MTVRSRRKLSSDVSVVAVYGWAGQPWGPILPSASATPPSPSLCPIYLGHSRFSAFVACQQTVCGVVLALVEVASGQVRAVAWLGRRLNRPTEAAKIVARVPT
jgi:hypothetical protein